MATLTTRYSTFIGESGNQRVEVRVVVARREHHLLSLIFGEHRIGSKSVYDRSGSSVVRHQERGTDGATLEGHTAVDNDVGRPIER